MPDAWSGVVLAGGRSSRMGRDKAFLVIEGQTLISRQVALLRASGCDDVLISGRADVNYAVTGARVVYDSGEGLGPLSGIVAAFSAMKHDRLVVLAVDLPAMTTALLQRLLRTGTPVKCTVPHGRHGFEPLAAVYTRPFAKHAEAALARGEHSLQALLAEAESAGLVTRSPLTQEDEALFENWNQPEDVRA